MECKLSPSQSNTKLDKRTLEYNSNGGLLKGKDLNLFNDLFCEFNPYSKTKKGINGIQFSSNTENSGYIGVKMNTNLAQKKPSRQGSSLKQRITKTEANSNRENSNNFYH